jgi:PilZ domain
MSRDRQAGGELSMPDVMIDRRISPRYPLVLVAEVIELSSHSKMSARSSDVSRTGCYVDTLNPLTSGTKVLVRLTRGKDVFESSGTVRYVSPGLGMGIQFDEHIPTIHLTLLDHWIEDAARRSSY